MGRVPSSPWDLPATQTPTHPPSVPGNRGTPFGGVAGQGHVELGEDAPATLPGARAERQQEAGGGLRLAALEGGEGLALAPLLGVDDAPASVVIKREGGREGEAWRCFWVRGTRERWWRRRWWWRWRRKSTFAELPTLHLPVRS